MKMKALLRCLRVVRSSARPHLRPALSQDEDGPHDEHEGQRPAECTPPRRRASLHLLLCAGGSVAAAGTVSVAQTKFRDRLGFHGTVRARRGGPSGPREGP